MYGTSSSRTRHDLPSGGEGSQDEIYWGEEPGYSRLNPAQREAKGRAPSAVPSAADQGDIETGGGDVGSRDSGPTARELQFPTPIVDTHDDAWVADRIKELDKLCIDLSQMCLFLGTGHDSGAFREQLSTKREDATACATAIAQYFTQKSRLRSTPAPVHRKLQRDFVRVAERLKNLQMQTARQEQEHILRLSSMHQSFTSSDQQQPGLQMTPNADIQALQQSLVEGAVTAREFDDLAERLEEYDLLVRDANQVQQLVQQVNELAVEDAAKVQAVEGYISHAETDVRDGLEHLEQAKRKQKKRNRTSLLILVISIAVLLAIILPIVLTQVNKKDNKPTDSAPTSPSQPP